MRHKALLGHAGVVLTGPLSGKGSKGVFSPLPSSICIFQGTSHALWPPWRASVLHGVAGRHCLPCLQPDAPAPACRLGPGCLLLGVWPRAQVKLWRHCVSVMASENLVRHVYQSSSVKKRNRLLLLLRVLPMVL